MGVGALTTAVYASSKHGLVVIPALACVGCIGTGILIGAVAGLWAALCAALCAAPMSPTQALWNV